MIYGEKFLNIKSDNSIYSFNEIVSLIEIDLTNTDFLNEGGLKDFFHKAFNKFKQAIRKIIDFISNILIAALEKIIKFASKIIQSIKNKRKIDEKDIENFDKSMSPLSTSSPSINEFGEYRGEGPEDDNVSDGCFRYYLRYMKVGYWSAVKKFKESLGGYPEVRKKYRKTINLFCDKDFDNIDQSINELENEYNKYEEYISKLFDHFVNNYEHYDPDVDTDDWIFNWESLNIKKEGESIYFASSIIAQLQDQIESDKEMIKSLKDIKNELNEFSQDVNEEESLFKDLYEKDHPEKINNCFTIISKYISLTLKTTNNIIDNYVACMKTNGKSLEKFAKYNYKNLYE